jgi:hypothetical protein
MFLGGDTAFSTNNCVLLHKAQRIWEGYWLIGGKMVGSDQNS